MSSSGVMLRTLIPLEVLGQYRHRYKRQTHAKSQQDAEYSFFHCISFSFIPYVFVVISSRAASDRIWRTGTSGVAPLHSRGQPPGCGSCPFAAAMQNPLSAAVTMFAVPTFPAAKSRNKPPVYFFAKSIIPQFLQKINDCKKNIMISQQNRKRRNRKR